MTTDDATTDVAERRTRSIVLGVVALLLSLVPAVIFIVAFSLGNTPENTFQGVVDIIVFGVPAAIVLSAVFAIIAIAIRAGRVLGIITLVMLLPQAAFLGFAIYAIFTLSQGGAA